MTDPLSAATRRGLRKVAGRIARPKGQQNLAALRCLTGQVTAFSGGVLTVNVNGDSVQGANYSANYAPTVGDLVWVLVGGGPVRVLCKFN